MIVFLTLGEITFANTEIPESINFGGEQAMAVRQLIGGQRDINTLGRVDDDISWSGLFFGSTALFRAQFLDGMRIAGSPLPLTWSLFNYQVIIRKFTASYERDYQIPYSITVTIVKDYTFPIPILLPVGYNDVIDAEMTEAIDIATVAGNDDVLESLEELEEAISAIQSLTDADAQQISSVMGPLGDAVAATGKAISEDSAIVKTESQLGAVITIDELMPDVISDAMQRLAQFYQIEAILINMQSNLILIQQGASGKTVTVQNGNLYRLAAENYNDATQWTTIATANGLSDPYVTGGSITNILIRNGGIGYINPIVIAVGDFVYQANLKANVVDGVVISVRVITGGLFNSRPEILFIEGGRPPEFQNAEAIAVCAKTLTIPASIQKDTGGIYTT